MDFPGPRIFNELFDIARPFRRHTARFCIVINTHHVQPQPGLFAEAIQQRQSHRQIARDGDKALVITAITQPARAKADQRSADH
ncbi:hypothetical protein D3C87_1980000 [compost metagenome]